MTKNKPRKRGKPKVFVGMSGGVDSSVSAAILKHVGFDVTGVFIKVWQPDFMPCSWKEERLEAMRVAAHLDIPFITLDLEKEYKKEVVDYMISEYKKGRTPNPDVMCNKYIKFGGFFDYAMKNGADFVATGHYARTTKTDECLKNGGVVGSLSSRLRGRRRRNSFNTHLSQGFDNSKDQSYFLWTLTQKQLTKTLFPVGDLEKSEVRKLAKKFKLPNADKKDSQGLCFVGKIDMKEFLEHYIKQKPGDVLNEKGEIIGKHEGALFYTIGERHGFVITKKTPDEPAYFVISKNIQKNTITVSTKQKIQNKSKKISILNTNWISDIPSVGGKYTAQIRYRGEQLPIIIGSLKNGKATIESIDKSEPVASGQSLVVYHGKKCLGGGIID